MSNVLIDLLGTVLIAMGLFALGFFIEKARSELRRQLNTLKRVLPFTTDQSPQVHLCYGLIPPGTARSYSAEEGDLAAIYRVFDSVAYLFHRDNVIVQDHTATEANLEGVYNLVTMSGPRWNPITELMLGKLGSPVIFSKKSGSLVYKTTNGETIEYPTFRPTPPNPAKRCYGLILSGRVRSSEGTEQRVLLCAGNTTLSTFGVATLLKTMATTRTLTKVLKTHDITREHRWGLIIEVTNNMAPLSEGLIWLPLKPGTIDTKIVVYIAETDFFDPYRYEYANA